jgi:hypothetical protein
VDTSNEPLIVRQAVRVQVPVDYVQVTADNQRAVADWCGGVVTDELEYSEPVQGYIRPNSDDAWYLAVLVPGVVLNTDSGPLVARLSDYVIRENGAYQVVVAEDFARDYRDVFKRRRTDYDQ